MPRALLYLMLSVPLLTPPGFCLCHLGEAPEVCATDEAAPADNHRDDDPNCPCHNADAFVRGFLPPQDVTSDGHLSNVSIIAVPPLFADVVPYGLPNRENVPSFPVPSRFVVHRALLI